MGHWRAGEEWVRQPPDDAITDAGFFPFYQPEMTFEAFIPAFSHWLAAGRSLASLIGIRTDESLHRYMALTSPTKLRFEEDKPRPPPRRKGSAIPAIPSMTGGPATSGSLIISRASPTIRSMT